MNIGIAKACWGDNTLLPGTCVIDEGERWNCVHAQEYARRFDCEHWNEVLSLDLSQEILGDGYKIVRVEDDLKQISELQDERHELTMENGKLATLYGNALLEIDALKGQINGR